MQDWPQPRNPVYLRSVNSLLRLVVCGVCLLTGVVAAQTQSQHKNLVFFLVDDLGWADLGCYGSQFYETPHIDALAASGMRFTQAYAAGSVCSPTRASILTGRHPVRVDITDWIPGQPNRERNRLLHPEDRYELPLREVTLAEVLKTHGYQTFFAGKWHLGNQGHWPTDQGFDHNIGGNSKGSPPGGYYGPWNNPTLEAHHDGEYLTERLTTETINFLESTRADAPFMVYLSYYNVHTPIQAYRERIEHFESKAEHEFDTPTPSQTEHEGISRTRQDNPALASMISAVDLSVGQILAKLDQLNLSDQTVVVFFSDNGGLCTLTNRPGPTSNAPLRAGKGWLYEGGVREPAIIRAPGVTHPGSVCSTPIVSMDFFPTFLDLADLPLHPKLHVDGLNLGPLLRGNPIPDRTFYWHYPHYHGSAWKPGASILENGWKLIEFYHYDKVELYHLEQDLGEQNDLADTFPKKTNDLRRKLKNWQQELNAQLPKPNPDYAGQ